MSTFIDQHGMMAAFVFLLIEEAGVPVPIPGDFLMLLLGVRAHEGRVGLLEAILVMEAATCIGATFLYGISRWAGRSLVYRYGRYIRLNPERLDRAEIWLNKHGSRAVFLGRLFPGLRIVTAVACGVFEVPLWVFVPAMSLGALLYIVVYTLIGYFLGPTALAFLERLHLPFGTLGVLALLVLLVVWTIRARQGLHARLAAHTPVGHMDRLRGGALAGGLATIAATLSLDVAFNLAGNIALRTPDVLVEMTVARLAQTVALDLQPLLLFLVAPAYIAVGVLWGAVYGIWFARYLTHMPDWGRGLVFATLPLLTSVIVALPVMGQGIMATDGAGTVAIAEEVLRHAVYGVMLGLLYPVLALRRRLRLRWESPTTPEREREPTPALDPAHSS